MTFHIKNITTIIFDFDYTLADSSRGVLSCNNYALGRLGYPETTYEISCRTIGLSLWETYHYLTGDPAENGDEFHRLFIERAEEVMADSTVLFDETPETIRRLKISGYNLGIVSTKFRYRIETILRREKLLAPFDVIVGGEDVSKHKPDPESLLLALDKLGSFPGNTLYIGDSLVDAKTAEHVGTPFFAVLSGVTPGSAFNSYKVVERLKNVSELPAWINTSIELHDD
jgi:phosphoglycolate phosphatase